MIAEIPAPEIEKICQQIVSGSLWFISVAITAWVSYRYGLRSQNHAARLAAKNAACAYIDRIAADFWDNRNLWSSYGKHGSELKRLTLEFSSQFAESDRVRIKKALDDYQKLHVASFDYPAKGTPEREKFDAEHKAMTEGLKRLRDEISDT